MHDLFEGVVKKELNLFLTYCTCNGYITIEELNKRIQHYDFNGSKPSLIETKRQAKFANQHYKLSPVAPTNSDTPAPKRSVLLCWRTILRYEG